MANYSALIATINEYIKTNGSGAITGQILNSVLKMMVADLGKNYAYAGIATPSTNPGTPDTNVFYLASQAGIYSNFGNFTFQNGISILAYNGMVWSGMQILSLLSNFIDIEEQGFYIVDVNYNIGVALTNNGLLAKNNVGYK